ncbi:PRD domain-containing protein [Lacticaseibacillus saniviri]|nr:PRD domain-containing protein [Lacticaseibacillus saniviri]
MLDESSVAKEAEEEIIYALNLAKQQNIQFTEVQTEVLANHVIEMVMRSQSGEQMAAVDPELFAEVSPVSLQIARQITEHIGHLSEAEPYVLSIHFEAAQNKL